MTVPVPTAQQLFFSEEKFAPAQLEELERAFFSNIIVRNGTFKTTNHRRLDDLNELVQKYLPSARPLQLMDVAVSSGISTGEWVAFLERAAVGCRIVAGDLFINGFLISVDDNLRVLVDDTGYLLQFDVRGRALRPRMGKRGLLLNLFRLVAVLRGKKAATRFASTLRTIPPAQLESAVFERWGLTYRPLKLVSRSLTRFAQLEVVEDDILHDVSNYRRSFHVVRAANILNLGYFAEPVLTTMLRNLRSRLLPGGILVVCRTNHQDVNNATVFALNEDGTFKVKARLNDGSEVESLAMALPVDPERVP
jgi:hypothetical protein